MSFTKKNSIEISFDNGFKKDTIKMHQNGKIIFDEILTTDNTIGLSKRALIKNKKADVTLFLNAKKMMVLNLDVNYPIIAVDKKEDNLFVEFRKFYRDYL